VPERLGARVEEEKKNRAVFLRLFAAAIGRQATTQIVDANVAMK